ncbi:MAG: alpha/beta hydrolase [Myxococcaceae bacterium]|nr:alpha/beta hydrolase [Myxococcaceae bacterium]
MVRRLVIAACCLALACAGSSSGSAGGGNGGRGGGSASGGGGGGSGGGCAWTPGSAGSSSECAGKPGAPTASGEAQSTAVLGNGFTRVSNLTYASRGGFALQGDLLVPRLDAGTPGILLVVHGGGWQDCGRRRTTPDAVNYALVMSALYGVATFNLEYRLDQEGGGYPENLMDVKCAAQWLQVHAQDYGLDGTRLGIAGESAGAHLALMTGLTQGRADLDPGCGPTAPKVRLVLEYSGPADLPALHQLPTAVASAPERYAGPCGVSVSGCARGRACDRCVDASPVAHACEAGDTAVAVIHAPDGYDLLIPTAQARQLHAVLLDAGVAAVDLTATVGQTVDAGCDDSQLGQAHGWNRLCLVKTSGAALVPLVAQTIGPR